MNHSLYFHIPFCVHRCAYCDFNTYAGQEDSIPAYVDALCREVEFVGQNFPTGNQVHTIFFGGGTPSLLSPAQFDSIFHSIRTCFALTDDAEITIEANPGTVNLEQLQEIRAIGINRLSFGVQSANGEELRLLERAHDFSDVLEAVSWARRAGFDNFNLDLIYGLPEQTLETWQTTVERILGLHPKHISAYALTLEHGTPFGRWSARGLMPLSDPDLAAEMYEWAGETFEAAGYFQYEISNWAVDHQSSIANRQSKIENCSPVFACLHNLQYWRGLPYLGFGAGAHGYADGYRYSNVLRIKTYIDRMSNSADRISNLDFPLSPATVNQHRQSSQNDMSEYMLTGLRLTREGVAASAFLHRFGRGLQEVYGNEIDELIHLGLLEWHKETSEVAETSEVLRLTSRGRLLGNQVFMRFLE